MKIRICQILFVAILSFFSQEIYSQEKFKGYLKHDVVFKEINYKLYKGELIQCEFKEDRCCYMDYVGEICLKRADLSKSYIKKVDIYFDNVRFSDSKFALKDACDNGEIMRKTNDTFAWSYGFRVGSSEVIDEPILVELTHIPLKNNVPIYSLAFTKIWTGKIDGQCYTINIYKEDIDRFLLKYNELHKILKIAHDLNIRVMVLLQIFSERPEDDYSNNFVSMMTLLPADNSAMWPPKDLPAGLPQEIVDKMRNTK